MKHISMWTFERNYSLFLTKGVGGGGGGGSGGRVTWFLGWTERGSVAANSEQGGTLENGLLMRGKGGGSSVYYRAVLRSGKFYWGTTSQIKQLRALVGNSKSKMLSLRINKIFLQRFSRCADQTYLHISARKSLLSETPLGNCFEMFIVFCSITDKKNRKKIYLRIYSAQFSDWNCKMLLLRRKDNFL